MAPSRNAERLLAESAWLRALTCRLVGDGDAALDLQQEVALAALSQPAAPVGRSWLAAVARNLAITLRRRRSAEERRLRAAGVREPVPSAAELAAAAELQQRAVAAVLALPEVYRDTVLLRFMQGLSLHATALAMGVPEETVRTRQKRALALLRAELVPPREHRRAAFAALLAPLVAVGVAVKTKSFVVAAAGLLLAALLCIALPWRGASEPASPAARGVAAAVADLPAQPSPARGDEGSGSRERVDIAAVASAAAPATAQLLVRVRWHDGTPAAGVAVLCILHWDQRTLRNTDAAGEVRFTDLRPGEYSLETGDFANEWTKLAAGDDKQVDLKLRASTELRGLVVDAAGVPVPFAELLQSMPGCAPQWTLPLGRCDAAGHFTVRVSARLVGARDARGRLSDFLMLRGDDHVAVAPETITLRLAASTAVVRGRIVDEQRRPVQGAWVRLGNVVASMHPDDAGQLWSEPPPPLLLTDGEGRFQVDGMRPGPCHLLVQHRGLAPHREQLDLGADELRELAIVLGRSCSLRGTVADGAGQPVAGAEVECDQLDFPMQCDATTAADGAFAFADLPVGELTFTVTAKGFARAQRTLQFAVGETQQWSVALATALRIVGRLVDDAGAPIADWRLLRDGSNQRVPTDGDGRFVIADCEAVGNGLAVGQAFGFAPVVQRFDNVLPSANEQTFVVPRSRWPNARLRGRCVDAAGAPIDGAGLDVEQDGSYVLVDGQTARTAADGTFDLGPLPPGRFALEPNCPGRVFARVEVEVQPGEAMKELGDLVGRQRH